MPEETKVTWDMTLEECYEAGVTDSWLWRNPANRGAVRSWSQARFDHGDATYYGRSIIDQMRAYWCGVARTARGGNDA
jgi:hypothetical protein